MVIIRRCRFICIAYLVCKADFLVKAPYTALMDLTGGKGGFTFAGIFLLLHRHSRLCNIRRGRY